MRPRIIVYAILIILYVGFLVSSYVTTQPKIIHEEGSIHFFSCHQVDCAGVFIDYLARAQEASCAFYDLGDDTLIEALQRNENIEVIVFEENYETEYLGEFVAVSSKGLMHHKFCVIDKTTTITGSYNPTVRGGTVNDNYVVIITSPTIAQYYLAEFDQLGRQPKEKIEASTVNLSGTIIDVCFSPQDSCETKITQEIEQAQTSIRFLAFSFTSEPIARTLLQSSHNNITIEGVYEKTRISSYSTYHQLLAANLSVHKDGSSATMHEKLFLIDNHTAILGSYNPTASANNRNDENLLIVTNKPFMASIKAEYDRVLKQATLW